jgi:hypothetical protein
LKVSAAGAEETKKRIKFHILISAKSFLGLVGWQAEVCEETSYWLGKRSSCYYRSG